MKFSVDVSQRELMDDALLDGIAAQGVTAICLPIEFLESTPIRTLTERAKALSARGIAADTAHPRFGSYNQPYSLVNQYADERGRYLEQLKDVFARMAIFGARVAPLHTGGCCLAQAPAWSFEMCAESVTEIEPAAREAGVILALENTFYAAPQQWNGGTEESAKDAKIYQYDEIGKLCALIDQCASPIVKGCFDAGHAHFLGSLTGDHEQMTPRIALYHLHDNSRVGDSHLPPGYGTLDWKTLGPLVAKNESAHPCYIEAKPWGRAPKSLMIRQTAALLAGADDTRRCPQCRHLLLADGQGKFCAC